MGTGSTFPSISRDQIANFLIPVCSIKEQRQVVQEIESRFSSIEKIEQAIDENLKKGKILFQGILKKSFAGKLVAPIVNVEPASTLLIRVRQEVKEYKDKIKISDKLKIKKQMSKVELSIKEVLSKSTKPILAVDVWRASKHKDDVEAFYAELKTIKNEITEIKDSTNSYLSLLK